MLEYWNVGKMVKDFLNNLQFHYSIIPLFLLIIFSHNDQNSVIPINCSKTGMNIMRKKIITNTMTV